MNNDPNASLLGIVFLHFREVDKTSFALLPLPSVDLPVLCIEFDGFKSNVCVQSNLPDAPRQFVSRSRSRSGNAR